MKILNAFVIVVGLSMQRLFAQKMYDAAKDSELSNPLVVPASEASYHYTMIEVDTQASSQTPLYGLIGVILLDGVFTFSGIEESHLLKLRVDPQTGKRCMPFKGINVVHKCNHEYFVLNSDFVNIQKTAFQKGDDLSKVCLNRNNILKGRKFNEANDIGLKKKSPSHSHLVVRFGKRVLMAYKRGTNYNKCIGTYDAEDDYFTCMLPKADGTLEEFSMTSFLYDEIDGTMHRDDNTLEMDRDTFSNSRRARHFGRSNQNFQHFAGNSNYGRSDNNNNNRRNLRDSYMNENHADDIYTRWFPNNSREFPTPPADLTARLANIGLDESSSTSSSSHKKSSTSSESKHKRIQRLTGLPLWALDENHEIRHDLSLKKVVDEGLVLLFSMDKSGCHFLQSNYYGENTQNVDPQLRERISREVLGNRDVFLTLCKNIFGNFFLQRVIEYSNPVEQETIKRHLVSDMDALCLDKSACRVVQTALETLESRYTDAIVGAIPRKNRLQAICTDQNANHVIQKIVKTMPLSKWDFLVTYLCKNGHDNMLTICQDKYGCRVVQTIVEVLSEDIPKTDAEDRMLALRRLMNKILRNCKELTSNEFANYVIQHIIETPILGDYRNAIIESCLLRNLLSMSQEKYASHVIERAFCFAPPAHLAEMMEELFDGYVPHPDTGKDALDILIFHQFGNYVVQRILQICVNAVVGKRDTVINGLECREKFEGWLGKLYIRARKDKLRLTRFSSGKKIMEILETMESYQITRSYDVGQYSPTPLPTPQEIFSSLCPPSSLFSPSNTTSINWPTSSSRTTSLSSEHHDYDHDFINFQNF
uniref:PUM-HD domain-containing protein n=1 Tax=Caenorhabditis tropicalis TaxID=1561998 RepID=A0A1I7V1I0_9PELO